uniref:Transmembrane protein n=1 Tax=Globodera pallida TaxID=36090 RepID=A0A183CTV1_GLOPA
MENIRDQVVSYQVLNRLTLLGIEIAGIVGAMNSQPERALTTREHEYVMNAVRASSSLSTSMIMWSMFSVAALLLVGMGLCLFVQYKASRAARIENRERVESFLQAFRDEAQIINRRVEEKEQRIDRRMEEREDRMDRRMQLFEERLTQRIDDRMQLFEERMTQFANDARGPVVPPVENRANCNISYF